MPKPKDWSRTGDDNSVWDGLGQFDALTYTCGYCSERVASERGVRNKQGRAWIRVCPQCNAPTFFSAQEEQWPGPRVGGKVEALPSEVARIFEEARSSVTVNAHTGAVMLARKILMHVAVEKGAAQGLSFKEYVEWLVGEHYAPKGAEVWVDYIRNRGNEANHEIQLMKDDDAEGVLRFTEALLRNVYELPAAVPKPKQKAS